MKKIVLIAACLQLWCSLGKAQKMTDAISYLPSKANGVLVLNKVFHKTVKKWEVKIQTAYYDEIGKKTILKDVKTFEIEDDYFVKIDKAYLDGKHYFSVRGLDATGKEVVSQPAGMNGTPWDQPCKWWCVGNTYAYGLNLWVHPNGGTSRVQMAEAPAPAGAPYHYQWVSATQWPAFVQSQNPLYYGLTDFNLLSSGNAGKLIHMTDVPESEAVHDANNNAVWGHFYGVRKYYGPWKDDYDACVSNDLASGDENCIQNFGWAKGMINNSAPISTPLTCNGTSGGDHDANTPIGVGTIAQSFEPCLDFYNNGWNSGDNNDSILTFEEWSNIYQMITYLENCTQAAGNSTGSPFSWPENIINITFQPYDNSPLPNTPVVFNKASLTDGKGNIVNTTYTIPKGLIHIGVQYKDGSYGQSFGINKAAVTTVINQATFLKATIAPTPVQGNSFNLNLTSNANLSFTYMLYDGYGNGLFRKAYTTSKGQNLSEVINVPNGIPSGLLINKFVFSDGSQLTINSVK
ncbi:MAG: hypothetical protein QM534_08280 [Sediminibacterium sp.]|nr:hypothetical protein [Sediminibacterium sp.]